MNKHYFVRSLLIASVLLAGQSGLTAPEHPEQSAKVAPADALARLKAGNQRFIAGKLQHPHQNPKRRTELATGQRPFAIVLGCADSRTSPEVLFDQGLGDLFVIRVAGNVVSPSQVGSVEFAAGKYATRHVVVLGHSQCGAILATLEELQQPTGSQSRNLRSIVDRVRPSVQALLSTELRHDPEALVRQAVRANIRASADHLRHGSTAEKRSGKRCKTHHHRHGRHAAPRQHHQG